MKTKGTRKAAFGDYYKRRETTRDERIEIISLRRNTGMEWKDIAVHVSALIPSMPKRLCSVIAVEGNATPY